jgi:hypothetical protein
MPILRQIVPHTWVAIVSRQLAPCVRGHVLYNDVSKTFSNATIPYFALVYFAYIPEKERSGL